MKNVILVALFALSSFFGFVNAEVQATEAPVNQEQATGEAEGSQKEAPAQESPAQEAVESAGNDTEADAKKQQEDFEAMMRELNASMNESQNASSN